jgi:GNAT superfamily N-acetyltransferase
MTRYRRGTRADSRACYDVFVVALDDLGRRTGTVANSTADDPDAWDVRGPLYDHLAQTADEWWLAEDDDTSRPVGYARSILRDGTRELTEFFVDPGAQSAGIGRELLARAFSAEGARHRSIIATTDVRAMARYLRAGLSGRGAFAGLEAAPRRVAVETNLAREPLDPSALPFETLGAIDRALIGFRRDVDHEWLARGRQGWLYRRGSTPVAYAYHPVAVGFGGPYAALDANDLPALLAEGETAAADAGHATIAFDLPLVAKIGIEHLLARGFRIDPFVMLYFSDAAPPGFDRYVLTSPPFFL